MLYYLMTLRKRATSFCRATFQLASKRGRLRERGRLLCSKSGGGRHGGAHVASRSRSDLFADEKKRKGEEGRKGYNEGIVEEEIDKERKKINRGR